jgi:WD40 repeat protein
MSTRASANAGSCLAVSVSPSQSFAAIASRAQVEIYQILGTSSAEGESALKHYESIQLSREFDNFTVTDVSWSPHEEDLVAAASTDGQVVVLRVSPQDADDLSRTTTLKWSAREDNARSVNRVSWHPSERHLLTSACHNSNVRIWDIRAKGTAVVDTYNPRTEACRDVQFSPANSHIMAAIFENGTLALWDRRKPSEVLNQITAHTGSGLALAWSTTNEGKLATGGRDKTVKIWDFKNIDFESADIVRPVHTLFTSSSVGRIAWRPVSQRMQLAVTSSDKREVSIWNASSPNVPACVLEGHAEGCTGLAWLDTRLTVDARLLANEGATTLKKKKGGKANAKKTVAMGLHQHLLTVGRNGDMLVQDVRNGDFPRYHMAPSLLTIASSGHVAYHRGNVYRGDPLGLYVGVDQKTAGIIGIGSGSGSSSSSSIFDDTPESFGMNFNALAEDFQGQTSVQSFTIERSKSDRDTGSGFSVKAKDSKDREKGKTQVNSAGMSASNKVSGTKDKDQNEDKDKEEIQNIVLLRTTLGIRASFDEIHLNPYFMHGSRVGIKQHQEALGKKQGNLVGKKVETTSQLKTKKDNIPFKDDSTRTKVDKESVSIGADPGIDTPQAPLTKQQKKRQRKKLLKQQQKIEENYKAKTEDKEGGGGGPDEEEPENEDLPMAKKETEDVNSVITNTTGLVTIGIANIASLQTALQISVKQMWQGAEAGPFDPAMIRLLAQKYRIGGYWEEKKFESTIKYYDKQQVSVSTDSISGAPSVAFILDSCHHNRDIAAQAGLHNHAALWESIAIIVPALAPAADGAPTAVSLQMLEFTTDLLSSILVELLDGGDCQHFVVCCELLFNSGLLAMPAVVRQASEAKEQDSYAQVLTPQPDQDDDAGITTIPAQEEKSAPFPIVITAFSDTRKRESYLAYINLLTQLRLFAHANALISRSQDPYLSLLSRAGVQTWNSCSKCGKEIETGAVCRKCERNVALCSLCHEPVRGLHNWCPICSHGGHVSCMAQWFAAHKECAAGCGHQCRQHLTSCQGQGQGQ